MEETIMKKKKMAPVFKPLIVFCTMWGIYYIVVFTLGDLRGMYSILINLLPFFFFAAIALALYVMSIYVKRLSAWVLLGGISALVVLDQGIKWLIRSFPVHGAPVHLLFQWLYFNPVMNTKGSWLASWFKWDIGVPFFIVLNILVLPFLIMIYRFYIHKKGKSLWIDLFFLLTLSGAICSVVDKLVFGGSLDFFMLHGLFVADTKDFFLTFGMGCMIVELYNRDLLSRSVKHKWADDVKYAKDFINFTIRDIQDIFIKKSRKPEVDQADKKTAPGQ